VRATLASLSLFFDIKGLLLLRAALGFCAEDLHLAGVIRDPLLVRFRSPCHSFLVAGRFRSAGLPS
jgi:hypothetical protein